MLLIVLIIIILTLFFLLLPLTPTVTINIIIIITVLCAVILSVGHEALFGSGGPFSFAVTSSQRMSRIMEEIVIGVIVEIVAVGLFLIAVKVGSGSSSFGVVVGVLSIEILRILGVSIGIEVGIGFVVILRGS